MEFRYRAGEENPRSHYLQGGDGYYPPQHLRATYVTGGDLRRQDSLLQSHLPCPSSGDALWRELEKERIREEIIAREILLRREIEEEVRRELALEREFALRRQADRFRASSSSLLPTSSWLPDRGATLPLSVDSRIASHRSLEVGYFGRLPLGLQRDPTVTEIKSVDEIDKVKSVASLVAAGTKREPSSGNELAWLSNVKGKVQKEWSCALCQVRATSKEGLNEHLQGKRHRTKEAELKGSKKGGKQTTEPPALPEKEVEIPNAVGKDDKTSPKQPENQEQKRKTVGSSVGKKQRKRQKTGCGGKVARFVCELCCVKCYSEVVLQAHYRGKKHKALVNSHNGAKAAMMKDLHEKEDDGARRKEDNGLHKKEDVEGDEHSMVDGGQAQIATSDGVLKVKEGHKEDEEVEATNGSNGKPTIGSTNKEESLNEVMPRHSA